MLPKGNAVYTIKPNNAISPEDGQYGFYLNVTAASEFTLMVWMPNAPGEKFSRFEVIDSTGNGRGGNAIV